MKRDAASATVKWREGMFLQNNLPDAEVKIEHNLKG